MLKRFVPGAILALCVAFFSAPAKAADGKDIVDTAAGAGSFKTLLVAAKEAGLVDALKGKGPLTVFAPTDEAFAKVPKSDLDALLKDKEKLKKVLLSHVVEGKVMAADAVKLVGKEAKSLSGYSLKIEKAGEGISVGGSKVIKTDVGASNGVIHVIDTVILPK